jgi:hypothetical protein
MEKQNDGLKPLSRREFLKLASITGAGLLFPSRGLILDALAKGEDVVFIGKEDPRYEALRQGFNKRVQKHPQVIALCRNTEGVAEAVNYARRKKLPIAVKSGGHAFEGFSCNDGGLAINLSPLNGVEWRKDGTLKIGPACTLSRLYDEILPKGRILPAGSCGGVGIGGLTLGGGYGFFSRKYGLTCDSLMEATLVDGKGKIRSSKNDEDLLWACRGGGGGNFGVVTEMVFKTHPAPAAFQSHRFKIPRLDANRAEHILEKWFEEAGKLPEACFSAFVLNGKTLTILVTNYEEHTPVIQKTLDLLASLAEKTTIGAPQDLPTALKRYYGIQSPLYFKNASAGLYRGFDQIKGFIGKVMEVVVGTPGLIYQINTLGGAIATAGTEESSCYAHRHLPFLSELQTYWDAPGKERLLLERFKDVQKIFRKNGIATQYVNYPDIDFEDWETAYYGRNYARLQEIKERYDPENNFRHPQSVKA